MYLTINKIDDANRVIKCDTFKTLDDANARIEELKDLGLTDAFVIDTKTLSKNFSLGEIKHLTGDASSKKVTWNQDEFNSERENWQFKKLRSERNAKLAASDWTQGRDITLSNDDAWKSYRTALRDLPANTADPANPIWPEEPSQ